MVVEDAYKECVGRLIFYTAGLLPSSLKGLLRAPLWPSGMHRNAPLQGEINDSEMICS